MSNEDDGEVLFCPKCDRRESFEMSGSGTKGICLKCDTEITDIAEARCKAVHDCLFEMLGKVSKNCPESIGVDKEE